LTVEVFLLVHYARIIHGVRRFPSRTGTLEKINQRAHHSRWALWFRSLFSVLDVHDFVTLNSPWWTLSAGQKVREFLESSPQARALEWGSGASTVWLGTFCSQVVSIESDHHWAQMIKDSVGDHVTIVTPAIPQAIGHGGVRSKRWGFRKLDFYDYVNAPDYVDGDFDLIVIDGRAREACFEVALGRLAPGGIILFDNTNRRRYRKALTGHSSQLTVEKTVGLTLIVPWPTETSIIRFNDSGASHSREAPLHSTIKV
jgi:hypothetical protein